MVTNRERARWDGMSKLPPIGQEVTLTLDNSSSPTRAIGLGDETYEVKGKIAVKPSWDIDPDHFCVYVHGSPVPIRIVDIHMVVAINGEPLFKKKKLEPKAPVKPSFFIVTGTKGNQYKVTFDGTHWRCTCPGFGFRRNCRHINEIKAQQEKEKK